MIRIKNFNVVFNTAKSLEELTAERLHIPPQQIASITVVRKGIDARRYKGAPLYFVYMLDVELYYGEKNLLKKLARDKQLEKAEPVREHFPQQLPKAPGRPVVIGFGPAGMLAGYYLAKFGYKPLIIERGSQVDRRKQVINEFWSGGDFNPQTNVQFGEGGAGTFSDGKLTTRIGDSKIKDVLDLFVEAGAPPEIKYLHKPHIGTDILIHVVKNIREKIIALGGEIRFDTQVTDFKIAAGRLQAVELNHRQWLETDTVFLGIGHSARDTYEALHHAGVAMEAKPFAVGVRIEHPQELIDRSQYGQDAGNKLLPVADYALTYNNRSKNRSVYSFCMCPGGQVVAAASETGRLVVNGMSNYRRNSGVANSALLVNITPDDFGHNVLDGMAFQRKYEAMAFELGGSNYHAPVQTVGDFLKHTEGSTDFLVEPSYKPGFKPVDLRRCLPGITAEMLEEALPHFDKKIPGFAHDGAVMTGVEMRSSAPCRIIRDRISFQSLSTGGLYPMGEGAGYAGGIMSAAVDGINAVLAYIDNLKQQ